MNALIDHIVRNAADDTAIIGLLTVAIVANMPRPGSRFSLLTLYTWLYDSLQAFMAARNPHPSTEAHSQSTTQTASTLTTQSASLTVPAPDPTSPADPAQPKQ